ncbi:Histidine kinase-, DNA gyrase B-, and HSP90-like ATPase [Natronoarchaeum philippinense]|uniref:Histidine kinase-, DNA gyrase B-, and HSP90-like ATPase n=1 Tax=Natronoarchaeum philippinense TaxID=558529 RepID=A0A285NUR0_NATPI|nr:hybrid sensor histidine kinase/response regulator [Natronoarchaeum philippinense]SNZ13234.1 Histidine kinase-, DNA gyrase B-, and HSP90-like ATPase [Natronoarchaeum philippinense]
MLESDRSLDVLVIEDNEGDARLIERYIDRAETPMLPSTVTHTHHTTLEDGKEALAESTFDVLLLDLGLPTSQGIETLDRIVGHTDLPVIVLTGLQNKNTALKAIQSGAQDFLNKDELDPDTLTRAIRYAIERKRRESELRKRTDQLEVLNRIVRHDIQNDVNVIQGWADMLEQNVDDARRDTVQQITSAADHIAEITQNVETFLEAVAGDTDSSLEPVALGPVILDTVEKRRTVSDGATISVGELERTTVYADELLASVFENLIDNAVQHSQVESPTVEVGFELTGDCVQVSVADDGVGVPDGQKSEIFGKSAMGLDSSGTGIGLFLVDRLVDRYGGRVWVEDNDPQGAVFVVELRLAE